MYHAFMLLVICPMYSPMISSAIVKANSRTALALMLLTRHGERSILPYSGTCENIYSFVAGSDTGHRATDRMEASCPVMQRAVCSA